MGLLRSVGIPPVTGEISAANMRTDPLARKIEVPMGRGEREAVNDGSGKTAQDKAGEIFQDVSSSISGFWNRSKKKVEEQVGNIDTDQIKEQAGRIGESLGQVARDRAQQEVDGVRRDVEQVRKGNYEPLIKRGIEAGTFGAGGIAGEVAKRFGLGGKITEFAEQKLVQATRVDTAGFVKNLDEMFKTVDANGDNFMDKAEIEAAQKDKILWAQHAFTFKYLGDKYDQLQNLSNDEWFSESKGISRDDVKALAKAVESGTGFGAGIGNAFKNTWETTWHAGVAGGAAGVGHAFLKGGGGSGRVGLIVGGIAFAGGFVHDAADYLLVRRGKLETTIKDLG
jgi:hypothetical protein